MSRATAERVIELLGRVPLFQGLTRDDLERIAGLVTPREVGAGEFLFRGGDPGDHFYIVSDGAVEILRERPLGDHERLAVRRGGDAFGELSLLTDGQRTVSVRAVEDSRLLSVAQSDFEALVGGDSLSLRLMRSAARSLHARNARFSKRDSPVRDAFRELGRRVVSGLEPRSLPRAEGFRIAGGTAREESAVGGSLWDGFATEDGRTLFALMGVQGTGLPPAYLLGVARALLREVGRDEGLDTLLRRLNGAIADNLFEGLDECVEASLIHLGDGVLRWSSAGDQPAVVVRADGSTEDAPSHGPPLGILPHFDYGATRLELGPGDRLLAFSETGRGVVKGAVELALDRADAEPTELATLLRTALGKVEDRGETTDVSFVVVSRSG
ncbi:MAG: SpoIIE family protein phosphatase [Candidatus Longimicrobiales bacterium M2_2A_002]